MPERFRQLFAVLMLCVPALLLAAEPAVDSVQPASPSTAENTSQTAASNTGPSVVLLHGLARSAGSMKKMAAALAAEGYYVCNIGYPSTQFPVATLAADHVLPAIEACVGKDNSSAVNFVTHSLGGIIVRQLRATGAPINFGRVVMLGPPNAGSEVVDTLGGWSAFQWFNGPAGNELGTDALPGALGPTNLEVGIIAGRHSINFILSRLIPGPDDGKVAIEHTKLAGMRDFIVLPVSHPFLMKDRDVIAQTLSFLREGRFQHAEQVSPEPTPAEQAPAPQD